MSPSFASGANTAERVPITTRAVPECAPRQFASRSASLKPECSTAIGTARRERKRSSNCGVRPISGTSTSALRPRSRVRCTRRR